MKYLTLEDLCCFAPGTNFFLLAYHLMAFLPRTIPEVIDHGFIHELDGKILLDNIYAVAHSLENGDQWPDRR